MRHIGTRVTPSVSPGLSSSRAWAARSPPVEQSQKMPTSRPRAICAAGDVDDMAEQAADRRPEDVQDAKRRAEARGVRMAREGGEVPARLGVQNHRSLITMVSPGRTGKVIGTEAVTSLPSLPWRVSSA